MKSITRKAEADWKGNLEQGHGLVTTGSQNLKKLPFSFSQRVGEDEGAETNPEELIAAGLASCFAMALSKTLQDEDAIAQVLVVRAEVTLNLTDDGPKVNQLALHVAGVVAGFAQEKFEQAVETTRKSCPVYKLLEPGFETIDVSVSLEN